jgi:hypothetical protein
VRPSGEQWGCMYGMAGLSFDNIQSQSKRGTRITGWHKPDLFAPSALITSVRSTLLTSASDGSFCYNTYPSQMTPNVASPYFASGGTSFAAPVAAGAAVLVNRVYAEIWWSALLLLALSLALIASCRMTA